MLPVIIPGLIISGFALISISKQKKAKELKMADTYRMELEQVRRDIENKVEMSIDHVFRSVTTRPVRWDHGPSLQKVLKDILLKNPIVKYPFVIDSGGGFMFPMSRKQGLARPMQAPPAARDKKAAALFREGERLELKERKFRRALAYYARSLGAMPADDGFRPYIYNAIARCYFKLGQFPQAVSYYRDIILSTTPPPLRFATLRQMAVCYRQMNLEQKTIQTYLQLYEQVLQYENSTGGEGFTFFKNEALDYLNLHLPGTQAEKERFQRAKSMDRVQELSHLDISLRWRYFEYEQDETGSNRPSGNSGDAMRFDRIRQFHLANDQKTQFYKTVKALPMWQTKLQAPGKVEIHTRTIRVLDQPVEIMFTPLPPPVSFSRRLYFGFMISPGALDSLNPAAIFYKRVGDPDVTVIAHDIAFQSTAPLSTGAYRYPFARLSPVRFFYGKSLGLYARIDGHIARKVEQETRLNYTLMASFILVLLLGIYLFYKYLAREAQLVRLKSEFTDGASHTLKTPLTRIRMMAEKLQLGWVSHEEKKQEYLNGILAETDRMNEMITNMLDFSRIEAGRKQYRFHTASIEEIASQVVESYKDYILHLGFQLEIELRKDIPLFPFDREAITLVIVNLLQNAVKYSGREKFIRIALFLDKEKQQAVLEVEDHGLGMEEKEIKKIFGRFYRAADHRTQTIEGSGLGLFLARHAVHAHRGEITVSSQPGKGSCFRVNLPLHPHHPKETL
jgi:pentatricopeptide repeat protein